MIPLIIYHAHCMDGSAAALAAWLKFGDEAEYRPAQYGDPAPTDEEVRGRDVFILDFSYPRAELVRMAYAKEVMGPRTALIVLDHHRTAQADLAGLPFCTFNMNKSGAVLAWEHFNKPNPRACEDCGTTDVLLELFAYVQDRDLWQWKLPHSREVSAALGASGALTDFRKLIPIYVGWNIIREDFDQYGRAGKYSLIEDGAAILRTERQIIERIVATAEEVEIVFSAQRKLPSGVPAGRPNFVEAHALAVTSAVLQSEVGEALALESARRGRDAVGVVYYRDGSRWRVSLRSRDYTPASVPLPAGLSISVAGVEVTSGIEGGRLQSAPDVSAIAKSFGGGGHKQAAGFECTTLPWEKK